MRTFLITVPCLMLLKRLNKRKLNGQYMFHVWKDDRCSQDFTLCERQLEGLRYG